MPELAKFRYILTVALSDFTWLAEAGEERRRAMKGKPPATWYGIPHSTLRAKRSYLGAKEAKVSTFEGTYLGAGSVHRQAGETKWMDVLTPTLMRWNGISAFWTDNLQRDAHTRRTFYKQKNSVHTLSQAFITHLSSGFRQRWRRHNGSELCTIAETDSSRWPRTHDAEGEDNTGEMGRKDTRERPSNLGDRPGEVSASTTKV
ncbi:uncharacterized protein FOMMEDRAFT_162559 [Fomitiporia mediterranea MF3/22]|uniref:Uncharacterized protein n=1 Tax=Fomitiporia mediterranea (strain MF3/22) TaxID=694068 RepID=R7SH90_FOMME|nr:uncharacterized protein FOMMEDRAFT_162559 [Fomitiporia mediterranea MF3/22]EJC97750.1 hypothetical protein FOMMEDRAFT_162559 [Fomitiporia mediterranea MF3/22]